MQDIGTVVWDVGGVLIPETGGRVDREVAKFLGVKVDRLKQITGELKPRATSGNITLEELYEKVIEKLGLKLAASTAVERHMEAYEKHATKVDAGILRLIDGLTKAGIVSLALTNTEREVYEYNSRRGLWGFYPGGVIASVVEGVGKPHPLIYGAVFRKIGRERGVVYIDDNKKYVRGAEESGMKGVHYRQYGRAEELGKKLKIDFGISTGV